MSILHTVVRFVIHTFVIATHVRYDCGVHNLIDLQSFYSRFGELLSRRRNHLGITQEALGKRVGLTRASIANIETGRQKVLVHHLSLLAAALELDAGALLPSISKPPSSKPAPGIHLPPLPNDLSPEQRLQVSRMLETAIARPSSKRERNSQ
jgi:transcriptional regulator with XRE-family HTH domain